MEFAGVTPIGITLRIYDVSGEHEKEILFALVAEMRSVLHELLYEPSPTDFGGRERNGSSGTPIPTILS